MNKDDKDVTSHCGRHTMYRPEFFSESEGKWRPVPVERGQIPGGVPQPRYLGAINEHLGFYGYEQAWALAWMYAAHAAASERLVNLPLRIRIAQYESEYEFRYKRLEMTLEHAE